METRPAQLAARSMDMKRAVRKRMRQQQPGLPTWRRCRRSSRGANGREEEGAVEQRRQQSRLPLWERGRRSSWRGWPTGRFGGGIGARVRGVQDEQAYPTS
ncbi:hypothetical protein VPH35_052053 [Triticum aestivum]